MLIFFNIAFFFILLSSKKLRDADNYIELPGGTMNGKESTYSAEAAWVSISGLGISPGEENSNPLHYSCRNSMDREA